MSKRVTVSHLAKKADMDLDEALVMLWDAGLDHVDDPDDVIPQHLVKLAEHALDIEHPKEQTKIDYWLVKTNLSRSDFVDKVGTVGIRIQPKMRKLPKGALRKIRKLFANNENFYMIPQEQVTPIANEPDPIPHFIWSDIGNRRHIDYLSEEDVLQVHDALVADFASSQDPISPPGLRDANLFGSAISRPKTALGDELKYPTVEMAAAALMHSIILNHCFNNGNKRTGLVAMLVFLDKNSMVATCNEKELFRFTLKVAQHRLVPLHYDNLADREVAAMAQWIKSQSRRITKGEHPIPWHRLKRILKGFGCEILSVPGKGNRIDISRKVEEVGFFKRKKERTYHAYVRPAGDGATFQRSTINDIRRKLRLIEDKGVDSKVFYQSESEPDHFIQEYRTLLRRLGKL